MPKSTPSAIVDFMKLFDWDQEKNQQLVEERGIFFEEVIFYLQSDGLLDDIAHPNQIDYSHQRCVHRGN